MASGQSSSRRSFLRACVLAGAGVLGSSALLGGERLLASPVLGDPGDPEVPNEQVAKILKDLFGDRPIQKGHITLDMPLVAEDGRIVPVIIESELPMTADQYVKACTSSWTTIPTRIWPLIISPRRSGRCRSKAGSR